MNRVLHLDIETSSCLELKKCGASKYSRHNSTIVTCMAWAFDDGPVQTAMLPVQLPDEVAAHIFGGGEIHAWNVSFERAFVNNYWQINTDPSQWNCTMQRALHAGLPAALGDAGFALRAPIQKDIQGKRLMLKMAKPKVKGTTMFWHQEPAGQQMLADLVSYCARDVDAERSIGALIPKLPEAERAVSRLDMETNDRGIRLDLWLIRNMLKLAEAETYDLNDECRILTNHEVTSPGTQTERLTKWFVSKGVLLKDVSKEAIGELLELANEIGLPDDVIQVLAIRQKVAKSSVKKLQAMLNSVDDDERVRGTLQYYGAGRTGRWSGRLIQPQNFPRPMIGLDTKQAINSILLVKSNSELRREHGEPLAVISSCLRGCLIPTKGKTFFVFDLAQIEARVLAWLAGQMDVLDVFRRGEDVYTATANRLGLGSRTAGKVAVLGLGYGMGPKHFIEFAKGYGLQLDIDESTRIVADWRTANEQIVRYWRGINNAALVTLMQKVPAHTWGDVTFGAHNSRNGDMLMTIKLPSGRRLYYRNAMIVPDKNIIGRDTITYDGVDQFTKKWGPVRTWGAKLVENITQAVARDVITEAAQRVQAFVGIDLVLSVHDELLFEVNPDRADEGALDFIKHTIEQSPTWAANLPVAASGAIMERYGK